MRVKRSGTVVFFIIFTAFMIMLLFLGIVIDETMLPSVMSVSEIKAQ